MSWTVEITPRFAREFGSLPARVQRAIDAKLDQFTTEPFSVDITKLAWSWIPASRLLSCTVSHTAAKRTAEPSHSDRQ